jgi:hypothetical protein
MLKIMTIYISAILLQGAWMIRLAFFWGVGVVVNRALEANMRHIAGEAHKEEIRSIREEMKTLQASNEALIALVTTRQDPPPSDLDLLT